MKKYIVILACLSLTACAGLSGGSNGRDGINGTNGVNGAPGKSAYQIWLDHGNTGTEQDFLDSLVGGNTNQNNSINGNVFTNAKDYLDYYGYEYIENTINWQNHNNFKQYVYQQEGSSIASNSDYTYTYNEKELTLGNYGVYLQTSRSDFSATDSFYSAGYIHNRLGAGANVYIPQNNTVFTGGTLAYLYGTPQANPILLKGDATLTYGVNPVLELAFDNYYTITLDKNNVHYNTNANVQISGTNTTGINAYDLQTGTYEATARYLYPGWGANAGYVMSNGHEEAFMTYGLDFYTNDDRYVPSTNTNFSLSGAFGGTKQ